VIKLITINYENTKNNNGIRSNGCIYSYFLHRRIHIFYRQSFCNSRLLHNAIQQCSKARNKERVKKYESEIDADSDSMAYRKAYIMFIMSKKTFMDMSEAYGVSLSDSLSEISFSVYDYNGRDITNIQFSKKESIEKHIEKVFFDMENIYLKK